MTRAPYVRAGASHEDEFRLLLGSFRDSAVLRLDDAGRIASWDESAARLLALPAAEALGSHVERLYAPEDARAGEPAAQLEAARRDGLFEGEGWRARGDGSLLWATIAITPIPGAVGRGGFSYVVRDMTQRRQAEQELRETEEGFRLLVEGVKDYAIFLLDPAGRVASWNEGARRMHGHQPGDIVGCGHDAFYRPEDVERGLPQAHLEAALHGGRCESEGWRLRRDGSALWAHVALAPLHGDDGALRGFSCVTRDMTERRRYEDELAHRALHDPLTGLPNRDLLLDRLAHALERSGREPADRVAVLFVDLDRFEAVNGSLGHVAGDELIVALAERMRRVVRAGDTVARLAGDEFVVLCDPVAGRAEAEGVARRIGAALALPISVAQTELALSASVGVAIAKAGAAVADELLRDAHAATYVAKRAGGARHAVFDESMRRRGGDRLAIEGELRRALARGDLRVAYQPQVDVRTGRLAGVEALARWRHPERGEVAPAEFIPLAEETLLIGRIGRLVLEDACGVARRWGGREGLPALKVSINVSPAQLALPGLVAEVRDALARSGVEPGRLCLEITESVLMDAAGSARILGALRDLGVELAIDDFGTGYSSLTYLRRFPVGALKIDGSFVEGVDRGADETAIVAATISMAHALGLVAVAEGVETDAQLAALRELGCDLAQGYLIAPAVAADELVRVAARLAAPAD